MGRGDRKAKVNLELDDPSSDAAQRRMYWNSPVVCLVCSKIQGRTHVTA